MGVVQRSAFLSFFLLLVSARWTLAKDCNVTSFQVQENFDLQRFMGKWYEIKWIPSYYIPDEDVWPDFTHTYTARADGNVDVSGRARTGLTSTKCVSFGGYLNTTGTNGKLLYKQPRAAAGPYWIITTDYDNYALAYGCRNISTSGLCYLADTWVWSRSQDMSSDHMRLIDDTIEYLCLNQSSFSVTPQTNECLPKNGGSPAWRSDYGFIVTAMVALFLRAVAEHK